MNSDTLRTEFAARLKKAVENASISQREIAERLGISANALSNYVTGKRVPDALLVATVSHLLYVNPRWLLTGEGEMLQTASLGDGGPAHIDKETGSTHILHTFLESEYVVPAMIELTPVGEGFSLSTYGTGAVALKREYVIRQWGFDPSFLRTVKISSNALQRRFRVGEEVLVDPLFDVNEDSQYLDFRYALDVIVEEGYYLLANARRPFWRQIAIADQPDTLIVISHEEGVESFQLTPGNRENVYAIYHIIAGEPPLYALPNRRRHGNP